MHGIWAFVLAGLCWSLGGRAEDTGCYVSTVDYAKDCESKELCARVFDKNSSDECEALATDDPSKHFYPVFARDEESCRAYVQFKKGCQKEATSKYISGGDIILTKSEHRAKRLGGLATRGVSHKYAVLWPKGDDDRYYVPYDMDESEWTEEQTENLRWSLKWIEANSLVRFVRRTDQEAYLLLVNGGGCGSYIGGWTGMQKVTLHPGCRYRHTLIHELFHALGLPHEHTRPDRDEHLQIYEDNVAAGKFHNFEVSPAYVAEGPYDFASIMHYSTTSFAKENGLITMKPRDASISAEIMNSRASSPSACDFHVINKLYPGFNYTEPCVPNTFIDVCEPTDQCTLDEERCLNMCRSYCDYNLKSGCRLKPEYTEEALIRKVKEMDMKPTTAPEPTTAPPTPEPTTLTTDAPTTAPPATVTLNGGQSETVSDSSPSSGSTVTDGDVTSTISSKDTIDSSPGIPSGKPGEGASVEADAGWAMRPYIGLMTVMIGVVTILGVA